ncbi:MAG TPA: acyl carrier protein [Rhodanobacteraceae bacterium]
MSPSIQQQVLELIAKHDGIDKTVLKPEATLKDLGVDSLDAIEIIFDIEEHFDVTLPDRDPNFDTDSVQGLVNAVQSALDAKANAAAPAAD